MAKYNDIKGALDFIRQGYSKDEAPFGFTVSDIAGAINTSEKKAQHVLETINDRAYFWNGNFPGKNDSFIVSPQVFERIKNWFN